MKQIGREPLLLPELDDVSIQNKVMDPCNLTERLAIELLAALNRSWVHTPVVADMIMSDNKVSSLRIMTEPIKVVIDSQPSIPTLVSNKASAVAETSSI